MQPIASHSQYEYENEHYVEISRIEILFVVGSHFLFSILFLNNSFVNEKEFVEKEKIASW